MSYVGLGALTPERENELRSLMPPCWSQEFEDCWNTDIPPGERQEGDPPATFPNCARLFEIEAEAATDEAGLAAAQAVPLELSYCAEPGTSPVVVGVVAAAAGLVLGAVLCSVGR